MDEMKWAWVLFVAATLALLIRLSTWFVPAPGWRDAKVKQAAETAENAVVSQAMPEIAEAPLPPPPEPLSVPPPEPPPVAEPIRLEPEPPRAPPASPPEEYHLRRLRKHERRHTLRFIGFGA